jgi:transposase-like protein
MKNIGTQKGQHIADLTEDQARTYLENILWPNGPVCPHCKSIDAYKMKGKSVRDGLHRCRACKGQFTVTIGTIFEDSHVPLRKWIRAFHLMCSSKKGISALQLQRNLGLGSYRTAWFMCHRIRLAMKCGPFAEILKGTIEVDETYVGGKLRRCGMRKSMDNKTPVLSLVERGGNKRSMVIEKVTAKNLQAAVKANVEAGSKVNTDELNAYKGLKNDFHHESVNHSKYEYVRRFKDGSHITTNTVESSFALLKRGIVGAFHHVSKKHLHRYLAEFDFRWNHRKIGDVERTRQAMKIASGKRLVYRDTKIAA